MRVAPRYTGPRRTAFYVNFTTFCLGCVLGGPEAAAAGQASIRIPRVSVAPDLEAIAAYTAGRPANEESGSYPSALADYVRVSGFVQRLPSDGRAATRTTEVFLGYDERALHAVFIAEDPEPERIRAGLASRENIEQDDFVTLMLDTDYDRRRAYAFRVNPLAVQWDALWTEGQGFDTSFDAVWESEGSVTLTGYVVRFEIPFKSLRFEANEEMPWGVVLSRDTPRDEGEVSYWPRVSSEIQGTLTQAARLHGIAGVSPGRNIRAIPYVTTRSFEAIEPDAVGGPRRVREDVELQSGADLKAVLDDRFVLDATLNPDFSQVESDEPQITVNRRFEVFFPERRPFFTENADFFRTPIDVVFTRRIADPRLGTRFTGKAGSWNVGALVIDDEAPGRSVPEGSELHGERTLFTTARLSRDVGDFSRLGAIYTARRFGGGSNQVTGTDGRARLDDHWTAAGQVLWSWTDDPQAALRRGSAAYAEVSRSGRLLSYSGSFRRISPEFEAQTGFVPRTDVREMEHFASYFLRPDGTLVSWGPELLLARVWDDSGELLDETGEISLEWNFVGQTGLEINYRIATQRLRPEDHPSLSETRSFDTGAWIIEFGTSHLDWLSLDGFLRLGDQINLDPPAGEEPSQANLTQLDVEVSLRPLTPLRIDNAVLLTRLEDPPTGGTIFADRIMRTRWSWQFTRALSARAILQYEHTTTDPLLTSLETRKNLNADFLVTYRLNPWTAAYLGVNANGRNVELHEDPDGGRRLERIEGLRRDAHQFFLKLSYLLRF